MFKLFSNLVTIFGKLAPEEIKKAGAEPVTADDLEKAGKSLHECLDAMHKSVTDHNEEMQALHNEHAAKCCKLHKAHMEGMHAHIEKIRKAMGAGAPTEQPTGGGVSDGEKALRVELEKAVAAQAELTKKIAELSTGGAAASGDNKAMVEILTALKATIDQQGAALKAQSDSVTSLAASVKTTAEAVKKFGDEIPPHGHSSGSTVLSFRSGLGSQPSLGGNGTESSGL